MVTKYGRSFFCTYCLQLHHFVAHVYATTTTTKKSNMARHNVVRCGVSVSDLYRVFVSSMVVTYVLHVCNVYVHNAQ